MTCKCEHWQVCDECRPVRFPKTEDKAMTKELLKQLQKFSQEVAELALNHSNSQQFDDMLGVKTEQFFDDHLKALAQQEPSSNSAGFKNFHEQLCKRFGYTHDPVDWRRDQVSLIEHIAKAQQAHFEEQPDGTVIPVDPSEKAQQEQPASVDAYVGAREDAAIWKKRALEAEELNRKFIAELNGPTYLGEPAQQEQPSVAMLKSEAATWKATVLSNQEELATVWRMNDDLKAEIALLKKKEQPVQKPDLWKTQFLTDVMTSAGLLRYGRTDKKLAQRIADGSARWRTELYTRPAPTQPALSDDEFIAAMDSNGIGPVDPDVAFAIKELVEAHCRGGANHE